MNTPSAVLWPLALCLIHPAWLRAEDGGDSTVRRYVLRQAVEVRASRLADTSAMALSAGSTIYFDDMAKARSASVAEALRRVPGVVIRDYGGSSALKTLQIRGTSSAQSALTFDGFRLNSMQNGSVDLGLMSPVIFDEVEVVRGASAVKAGAAALGGAVNFVTRRPGDSLGWQAAAHGGNGGRAGFGAAFTVPVDSSVSTLWVADAVWDAGRWGFPVSEFGELRRGIRANNDIRRLTVFAKADISGGDASTTLTGLFRSSSRGVPGPVLQGRVEQAGARLGDDHAALYARHVRGIGTDMALVLRSQLSVEGTLFVDPEATAYGPSGLRTVFTNRLAAAAAELLFPGGQVLAEAAVADLRGAMLQPEVDGSVWRSSASLAVDYELPLGGIWLGRLISRWDIFSDVHPSPSLSAELGVQPTSWSVISMGVARAFRPANFNEMYYLNYGTAGLLPERSITATAALGILLPRVSFRVDAWLGTIRDQIVAIPVSPVSWSARNVAVVERRGVEIAATVAPVDELSVHASMTVQRSVNSGEGDPLRGRDIVYVPRLSGNVFVDWLPSWAPLSIRAGMDYVGSRHSIPGNGAGSLLAPAPVFSSSVQYSFPVSGLWVSAGVAVENALGTEWAMVRNYPMPGRMVIVSFTIKPG